MFCVTCGSSNGLSGGNILLCPICYEERERNKLEQSKPIGKDDLLYALHLSIRSSGIHSYPLACTYDAFPIALTLGKKLGIVKFDIEAMSCLRGLFMGIGFDFDLCWIVDRGRCEYYISANSAKSILQNMMKAQKWSSTDMADLNKMTEAFVQSCEKSYEKSIIFH